MNMTEIVISIANMPVTTQHTKFEYVLIAANIIHWPSSITGPVAKVYHISSRKKVFTPLWISIPRRIYRNVREMFRKY